MIENTRLDRSPSSAHNRHGDNNGPTISTITGLCNSDLCARFYPCHSNNNLDSGALPVEEVDSSSPSDGGVMSGSDAERLDCANASDEHSLLLGGGDAEQDDDDDADLLRRIAPDAHWNPHAAHGYEATCTCQEEWPEWEADLPAAGNHRGDSRRDDDCGGCDDAGVVCTLSARIDY
jgi:hypothetical protein